MVFDVESVGLHGEGFAVGYVVIDREGTILDEGRYVAPLSTAVGSKSGRDWVSKHVPMMDATDPSPGAVRERFWAVWRSWAARGAVLVADCAWPVEARFLAACVDDGEPSRRWEGPYPLHELASFMVAAGMDPMATYDRLPDEPQHDPLGDAKQSARLLLQALGRLQP